ncbi:hypothetical protein O3Q52_38325 [Streptomyces sp. ActVer]|uniref:hypothetical protein n=1 Tax=Streptomyces sp. ActVer TaxID=3014558 RepID=UPI0022B5A285|nr:hypothetical protein [Streptomyces sp. ActVer]MCZ4513895.1 hypothetical protein [Streptomyces sp. ActVer]
MALPITSGPHRISTGFVGQHDRRLRSRLPFGASRGQIRTPCNCHKRNFAFFAAETERENIRESTLEGLDTAARKGKHGGRPPVITDDMLHIVLRRRANGETVEQIQPDLIIPTGKHKGHSPSLSSIYGVGLVQPLALST